MLRFNRARLPDLAAVGLLIAFQLALFWRALSGARVVAGYDLILYSYPYRVAIARALREGHLPFWNPDLFGGVPALANIQTAVFYPFHLLFVWPGGPQLLSWSIIVHLALAGIFFYAFARKALELSPGPSALAGLAFSASGFAIAQSEHLNQANALPWIPALLLAFDQAYRTRRPWWSALLGLILAIQIFAGHPQDVYYGLILLALWALVLVLRNRRAGRAAWATPLLAPALGLIGGLLVAAVQLLPTVELTRYSIRSGGLSWNDATAFSMAAHGMLGNLLPDYKTELNGEWAGYIGLVGAALGLFALTRRWSEGRVLMLSLAAVVAVLLALGPLTPAYWFAYHFLPGLALFRVPARAQVISTFAGSALAGIGAAELKELLSRRRLRAGALLIGIMGALLLAQTLAYSLQRSGNGSRLLKVFPQPIPGRQLAVWAGLTAVVAAAILLGRRRPGVLALSLLSAVALELYLAAQPLNPPHALPAALYGPSASINAALPSDRSGFRSLSLAGLSDQQLNGGLSDPRFHAYAARRAIDQPDFALQDGRASFDGYDGGILPLAAYVRFRTLLLPPGSGNQPDYPLIVMTDQPGDARLLGLLGVKDILVQPSAVPRVGSAFRPIGPLNGAILFENPYALPRTFLVHDVRPSQGLAADRAALGRTDFQPATTAIAAGPPCSGSLSEGDRVSQLQNAPEAVDVQVESKSGGMLVISTVNYPGWRATIDGRSAPVNLVDTLIQGVCLPAGSHRVELRFTPTNWGLAVAASAAGVLLLLYLGLARRFGGWRRRQFRHKRGEGRNHLLREAPPREPLG